MVGKIINNIKLLFQLKTEVRHLRNDVEVLRLLNGKMFANLNKGKVADGLADVEFKVFSQYGDDGIINYLTSNLDITNKVFVEFGVENYTESNTRFLLMNDNWRGLVMDGSDQNVRYIKSDIITRRFDIKSKAVFVTAENINDVIKEHGIEGEIGLLSVDIDGNDYWVWKAINVVNPVIVVSEFNSVWGPDKPYTIPYDPSFYRTDYHYSNLCYGSSLLSLCDLAEEKGYAFVGCNTMGNNAYFVRKNKLGNLLKPLTAGEGYVRSNFSESRNETGHWTYLKGSDRIKKMNGVKVYNTRTKALETINE